jgi:hypothetical protein
VSSAGREALDVPRTKGVLVASGATTRRSGERLVTTQALSQLKNPRN